MIRAADPCGELDCDGRLVIVSTIPAGINRWLRTLRCRKCGMKQRTVIYSKREPIDKAPPARRAELPSQYLLF
jgi:hypothetical protein